MSAPLSVHDASPPDAAGVLAPQAPGRLGVPLEPAATGRYLNDLERWCRLRRTELDTLDAAALAAPEAGAASATADLTLSMALWKAVSDRYALLATTWDGGRVGPGERERLAALIWGRLDALDSGPGAGATGLALSLPEACRLADSLVAALRVRLGLDLSGAEVAARLRALRAGLERIRDQVGTEPAGTRQQEAASTSARLARRLGELTDKAGRGGDVAGLLGSLEIEAAVFERDLIVGAGRRQQAGRRLATARRLLAELEVREATVRRLVDACVAAVDPAPRYAVPDVTVLGPVPNTPAALEVYLGRLEQVGRAMTLVDTAYATALAEHAELVGRLDALRAKARSLGVADQPELARAYDLAAQTLARRPCRMAVATSLVARYASHLGPARP